MSINLIEPRLCGLCCHWVKWVWLLGCTLFERVVDSCLADSWAIRSICNYKIILPSFTGAGGGALVQLRTFDVGFILVGLDFVLPFGVLGSSGSLANQLSTIDSKSLKPRANALTQLSSMAVGNLSGLAVI